MFFVKIAEMNNIRVQILFDIFQILKKIKYTLNMIQYPIICVQAEGSGFFYFSIHNMNIYIKVLILFYW